MPFMGNLEIDFRHLVDSFGGRGSHVGYVGNTWIIKESISGIGEAI